MKGLDDKGFNLNRITIILHGGAINTVLPNQLPILDHGVREACKIGYQVLSNQGTCVEAVKAAVMELENNENFNAGRGACLTELKTIELDAAIMNGSDLKAGAVASVQMIINPVDLAHEVMKRTPHVLLVGKGAMSFAKKINFPILTNEQFLLTESQIYALESSIGYEDSVKKYMNSYSPKKFIEDPSKDHDTVGAVAIDCFRNMASATSSGGIVNKMPGRVGDVPIIGGGLFADTFGAASATGHGEGLMRTLASRETVRNIELGMSPSEACKAALIYMQNRVGSSGGLVAVDSHGNVGQYHTTSHMSWASIDNQGIIRSFID